MSYKMKLVLMICAGIIAGQASAAWAETKKYTITIKDHQFSPKELVVPANEKVKLIIENKDKTAEEFESYDLNREKIVTGNGKITVFIGPLKPGKYTYFGEFNPKTAQGVIIATATKEKK